MNECDGKRIVRYTSYMTTSLSRIRATKFSKLTPSFLTAWPPFIEAYMLYAVDSPSFKKTKKTMNSICTEYTFAFPRSQNCSVHFPIHFGVYFSLYFFRLKIMIFLRNLYHE